MAMVGRQAAHRRVACGLVLAVLVVLAGACGTVSAFVDLQVSLTDAGFGSVNVNVESDATRPVLRIAADAPGGTSQGEAEAQAAGIAWRTFPRRFEQLRVRIDGASRTYSRAQLEQRFGPRPAGLDDKALADDVRRIGVGVILGLIGGLVCVGLTVVLVLVVVRSRRRRRGGQPGPAPWGYPPPGPWAPPVAPPAPGPWPPPGAPPPAGSAPPPVGWAPPPAGAPPPPATGWPGPPTRPAPTRLPPSQIPPGWD